VKPAAIIDCDPGHDDVMAILLAGRTLDLRAITTVHGNASVQNTTTNARKTVEFAGLTDIPIAAGTPRPLVREPHYAPDVHGESGLDGPSIPPPTVPILDEHAVDVIIERSRSVPDLQLVPVGPLTNVAAALIKDPSLPERIAGITLMGGSLTFGNVTPAAEFNIWCDPEAAHVVFTSEIPIRMVGLNVTRQVLATPDRRDRIRGMGHVSTTHVADMLDHYSAAEAVYSGLPGGAMHDPVAVAALVDPDIVTFEPMHVAIELSGTHTAGMTLCDGRRLGPDMRAIRTSLPRAEGAEPNAQVAVAVDESRFWDLFLDILATYP
jgi:inosine-uridine nucleoside N-ribohydrolase